MPAPRLALVPAQRPAVRTRPHRVDLHKRRSSVSELAAYRDRHTAAVRAAAQAPVRFVPAAFVDALQGSWGEDLVPVEVRR